MDKYEFGEQQKLPEYFANLRSLISDRGDRNNLLVKVDQLEKLSTEWSRAAAEPEIAARREMNEHPESLQDVAAMLEVGTGKRILDGIRSDFQLFIDEEKTLTAERFTAATLGAESTKRTTIVLTLISLLIGGCMALLITLNITKPVRSLATALGKVAAGDLDQEISNKSNDEIGGLSRSFNQMVGDLRQLDLDRRTTAERLKKSAADLAEEAAVNDALARLGGLMQNANSLPELSDEVISFLAEFTQSHVGAVYLIEQEQELILTGGYAFTSRERLATRIEVGKTLVGQAAFEKKSILITNVPNDYDAAESSLGEMVPRNLLVVPLLQGGNVRGVVELGSFESFSQERIFVLEGMCILIATAIDSLQRGERIQTLLEETQRTTEALGAANLQLESKSEFLERQKADIEQRNKELELVRKEIEDKARELTQASKYKSEFLANMSHEIRTPMTAILGFTEIVLENVNDPQNIDGLKTIQNNGKYLLGLINNILDLSKIESGQLEVEQIECSPCQILSDVASLMRVRSDAKDLALEIEYDGPIPCSIQSDPTRLRQILINLTGNAIKFSDAGTIRLVARVLDTDSNEPKMQFDVVDKGIGMTEEQIGKLFQPFVQADASMTRKFGGTGLGLAISKQLAGMLGGDITINVTTHRRLVWTGFGDFGRSVW